MTDETRPDPLAADFDPGSIPAAPGPTGGGAPEVQGVPDPSTDQWSAFDEPTPPAPAAATPPPAASVPRRQGKGAGRKPRGGRSGAAPRPAPVATTATTRRPPPWVAPTARKKATRTIVIVVLALLLTPIAIGVLVSVGKSDSDSGSSSRERTPVALAPTSVQPSEVPDIPNDVTSLRIEIQGVDRIADVRIYSSGDSSNLEDVALPYAATLPVVADDAYVSVSVDDYGYRGPSPMRCTIYAGDVVLSTAVGMKSVDCQVTDSTWQRGR